MDPSTTVPTSVHSSSSSSSLLSVPSSALLSPPSLSRPSVRSRASSSGIRPPLSLFSLSPRVCSNSFPDPIPDTPLHPPPPATTSYQDPPTPSKDAAQDGRESVQAEPRIFAMVPLLVSRTFDLVRALRPSAKHGESLFDSPVSSARSSIDSEYILPLSASRKSSFDSDECSPPPPPSPDATVLLRLSPFPSVHAPLLLVIILFPVSTAFTIFCLSTLPIPAAWPHTLADLAQIGRALNNYAKAGPLEMFHILTVLSVSAIWKHAWSIPGSVLWNVLAGALFHPLIATLVMTTLTTIGSACSTLLSMPLAPFLIRFFPKPIELTKAALEGSSSTPMVQKKSETKIESVSLLRPTNLTASSSGVVVVASAAEKVESTSAMVDAGGNPAWVRLSVLRLVGIVPWSALNIACGVTGVSIRDCMVGSFIGTLPWTAVTCQLGDILHTVSASSVAAMDLDGTGMGAQSISSVLASPKIIFQLVFLSVLSLAPVLGRDWLRRFISSSEQEEEPVKASNIEEFEEKEALLSSRASDEESDGGAEYEKSYERGRKQGRRQRWKWERLSMSIPRWAVLQAQEGRRSPCL